jgi:hypothetical protein
MGKKLWRKEEEAAKDGRLKMKKEAKEKISPPGVVGVVLNKPWSGSAAPTLPGRPAASLAALQHVHVGRQTTLGLVLGVF